LVLARVCARVLFELLVPAKALDDALDDLGQYDEAADLFRRSLAISERVMGPEHPNVVPPMSLLGNLLTRLGGTRKPIRC